MTTSPEIVLPPLEQPLSLIHPTSLQRMILDYARAAILADRASVADRGVQAVPGEPVASDDYARIGLLEWAVERWRSSVQNRPLVNIHRRTMDDCWRSVMRYAGGNPDDLVGPSHDDLLAASVASPAAPASRVACQHRITDARNAHVQSGYVCLDCGALFQAADHAAPASPVVPGEERERILKAAALAMPFTNPLIWQDWLEGHTVHTEADDIVAIWTAAEAAGRASPVVPIDLVLFCPACGLQHIDEPEEGVGVALKGGELFWDNPPHRSHLCHSCGHVWRPADAPTNGVAAVKTRGTKDSPVAALPGSAGAASLTASEPEPMFYGRWHHGNGNLCCGTMRYFRADFDTNPAPDVREGIFDWVCTTMNAALDRWREQNRAADRASEGEAQC